MTKNFVLGMLTATAVLALNTCIAKADGPEFAYTSATHNGGEYLVIEFDHSAGYTLAGAVRNWESNPPYHNYSKGKILSRCQLEWTVDQNKTEYHVTRYSCQVLSQKK